MSKAKAAKPNVDGSTEYKDQSEYHSGAKPRYPMNTPEEYQPMSVPEHIYVAGVPRKPLRPETKPEMVVPSRITVGGGNTTIGSKAQPVEVLREKERLLSSPDHENNIGVNGIPDMLTANELPQEDVTQQSQQTPSTVRIQEEMRQDTGNPQHYSSQTSISIDQDPLKELKLMRRHLNRLSNRVVHLELLVGQQQAERPYWIGLTAFSSIVSILLLAGVIRGLRRQ